MEEVLKFISDEMESINIPYEFGEWTSKIQYPYWVGEISEPAPSTEDGLAEPTVILTGTQRGTWERLMQDIETIREHFPAVGGLRASTASQGAIVVKYAGGFQVPTGEADLKRWQINLSIKKWSVI